MRSFALCDEIFLGENELVMVLAFDEVPSFVLEVTLLLRSMSELLVVRDPRGRRVELALGGRDHRGLVSFPSAERFAFSIDRDHLEALEALLLRAVRDGLAEVDHVHLPCEVPSRSFDLTVVFDDYRAPIPTEESERLMARRPTQRK